jgi:hypothetical protein
MDIEKEDKIDIERQSGDMWRSCCFTLNKQMLKYLIQVIILSSLIVSSVVMIIVDKECNSQRYYASILMICLGVFLPSPTIKS